MDVFWDGVVQAAQAMSAWEVAAVVLAVGYLVLAARENIWCWACAFVSTAIYTFLFFDVQLFLESALNVFYLAMAVYGWWQWRQGDAGHDERPVTTWPVRTHLLLIAATGVVVLVLGYVFDQTTSAALPYLDAFTTGFSVITTFMVTKKVLANWYYWFVIDSVSIYLYINRELYLTALLFVVYLVLIVYGYREWKASLDADRAAASTDSAVAEA